MLVDNASESKRNVCGFLCFIFLEAFLPVSDFLQCQVCATEIDLRLQRAFIQSCIVHQYDKVWIKCVGQPAEIT